MNALQIDVSLSDEQVAAIKWGARAYNAQHPKAQVTLEGYLALELGWRADSLLSAQSEERRRLRVEALVRASEEVAKQVESILKVPDDASKIGIDVAVPADPVDEPVEPDPIDVPVDVPESIKTP